MFSTTLKGVVAAQLVSAAAAQLQLQSVLTANEGFGISIANDDTIAAVGAWLSGSTDMPNQGKVEIYDCNSDCENVQTLTIPESAVQVNDFFGSALSIHNGLLVVGVPGHNVEESGVELTNAGAAVVYDCATDGVFNEGGCTIVPNGMLMPDASSISPNSFFGSSVYVLGNLVVVGAPLSREATVNNQEMENSGSIFVYTCYKDTGCTLIEKMTSRLPESDSSFGFSVAINSDNIVVVGSPEGTGENGVRSGKAYMFSCSVEKMDCIRLGEISPPDGEANDMFARKVAVKDGLLAISAPFAGLSNSQDKPGVVYVYTCEFARSCTWIDKFTGSASGDEDFFGSSLAVFNGQIAIGAQKQDGPNGETDQGAVYTFTCGTDSCTEDSPILTPQDNVVDFGRSLSYFGSHLLVGATAGPTLPGRKLSQEWTEGAAGGDTMERVFVYTSATSGVKSDPHFSGLLGQNFDFDGEVDGRYMLVNAPVENYYVLVRFGAAYASGLSYEEGAMLPYKQKGTWLSSLLVKGEKAETPYSIFLSTARCADCVLSKYGMGTLKVEGLSEDSYSVSPASSGFVVNIKLPSLSFSVSGVPPPASWKIASDDVERFSHLNLDIAYLTTADAESLDGILGATGRNVVPTEEENKKYEASQFVSEEVLAQL